MCVSCAVWRVENTTTTAVCVEHQHKHNHNRHTAAQFTRSCCAHATHYSLEIRVLRRTCVCVRVSCACVCVGDDFCRAILQFACNWEGRGKRTTRKNSAYELLAVCFYRRTLSVNYFMCGVMYDYGGIVVVYVWV